MHEDNTQIANLWMKKLEGGKSKVALAVLNYMCYSYWMYWKTSLAVFPDTDNSKLFSKWSSFVWSKHTVLLQWFFFSQSIRLLPIYKRLSEPYEINQNEENVLLNDFS